MGQATSRTKPSIVACEALARSPAIEVLCGEWDAARTETIPQPASKQTLKNRLIGSPFHWALHTPQPARDRNTAASAPQKCATRPCETKLAPAMVLPEPPIRRKPDPLWSTAQ